MISNELLYKIAETDAQYDVDSMSPEELRAEAEESRMRHVQDAAGRIDMLTLFETLLNRFYGDTDAMREFVVSCGVSDLLAKEVIADFVNPSSI